MAVGVFISRSGIEDPVVGLDAIARDLADRAVAKVYDDFFDAESRTDIMETLKVEDLDGVVLAGPSPHYYESTLSGQQFIDDIEAAGIDRNRVSIANILEQVELVHRDDHAGADAKARALIDVALLRLSYVEPLDRYEVSPRQHVLILGANVGGFLAAQRALQMGLKVTMIERMGGPRRDDPFVDDLGPSVSYVLDHPHASIYYSAEVSDLSGWCGDYEVDIVLPGRAQRVWVGGVILAASEDVEWVEYLRSFLRLDVDDDGHALTLNPRMLPVQTDDEGLMVLPARDGGADWLHDRVASADSAVLSLMVQLNKREICHHADVTSVDEKLCGGCASCVKTCAFGASTLDPLTKLSRVDIRRCRGCGKCVVSCPVGARDIVSSPNACISRAIQLLAHAPTDESRVLAFLCRGCGYTAADNAGRAVAEGGAQGYPASVLPIRIPCGGRLDARFVLEGFKAGFDGVMVARCKEGRCHNLIGNLDMDRRMSLLRDVLRALAIDPERLRLLDIAPEDGEGFALAARSFSEQVAGTKAVADA